MELTRKENENESNRAIGVEGKGNGVIRVKKRVIRIEEKGQTISR